MQRRPSHLSSCHSQMCTHPSSYWGADRLQEKKKRTPRILFLPFAPWSHRLRSVIWIKQEKYRIGNRKKVWRVWLSERRCFLPDLEGVLISSESRTLWASSFRAYHKYNNAYSASPEESHSPPSDARRMPCPTAWKAGRNSYRQPVANAHPCSLVQSSPLEVSPHGALVCIKWSVSLLNHRIHFPGASLTLMFLIHSWGIT